VLYLVACCWSWPAYVLSPKQFCEWPSDRAVRILCAQQTIVLTVKSRLFEKESQCVVRLRLMVSWWFGCCLSAVFAAFVGAVSHECLLTERLSSSHACSGIAVSSPWAFVRIFRVELAASFCGFRGAGRGSDEPALPEPARLLRRVLSAEQGARAAGNKGASFAVPLIAFCVSSLAFACVPCGTGAGALVFFV
jgi:hypothetical protein